MDKTSIVTLFLAIYGAALSTVLAIRQWKKDRPLLQVKCYMDECHLPIGSGSYRCVKIRVTNVGQRPVTVADWRLCFSKAYCIDPYQKELASGPMLPEQLDDGQPMDFEIRLETLLDFLRKRREEKPRTVCTFVEVSDTMGNWYKARFPKELRRERAVRQILSS